MSRPLFRLRDIMPKGLYWRTLLIIVAPAALLQLIITLVFLDDHWQATSKRMSQGVAADVALIIQLYEREPTPENFADLQSLALRPLRLEIELQPDAALAAAGLGALLARRPETLSGGEQQRLAVAMALVGQPDLVVADEPTAELDHAHADRVMDALLAAAAAGATVVVSSHDDRVTHRAGRLLRLRHGVVSSETAGRRTAAAVIDATGRLQLPPEVLDLFPDRRVVVEPDGDQVRLRRPGEGS